MQNGIATLENSVAGSSKVNYACPIGCGITTPRDLPKRKKNLCSHKNLSVKVCSGFMHNRPNLETVQSSSLVNGSAVVYPCNEIVLSDKKNCCVENIVSYSITSFYVDI